MLAVVIKKFTKLIHNASVNEKIYISIYSSVNETMQVGSKRICMIEQ